MGNPVQTDCHETANAGDTEERPREMNFNTVACLNRAGTFNIAMDDSLIVLALTAVVFAHAAPQITPKPTSTPTPTKSPGQIWAERNCWWYRT